DITDLQREQLFADYSKISSRRKLGAESTALRNRWSDFAELLAYQATSGQLSLEALKKHILEGSLRENHLKTVEALGSIGVMSVLSKGELVELDFGIAALHKTIDSVPKNRQSFRYRKLLVAY